MKDCFNTQFPRFESYYNLNEIIGLYYNLWLEEEYNHEVEEIDVWHYRSKVNRLTSPFYTICFILNIILPGFGTIISAFACTHVKHNKNRKVNWSVICNGVG
mmetsp:Transcript_41327/g.29779  ORF Transcript_41327/g.29779 Transcript_41327/m.29779 type:complete len:102 (+) Transcript_41327:123-428(+)